MRRSYFAKLLKGAAALVTALATIAVAVIAVPKNTYAVTNAMMHGVDQGMLNADYWLQDWERNTILMDAGQIGAMNMSNFSNPGTNMNAVYFEPDTFDGAKLKSDLAGFTNPKNLYLNAQPVPTSYYENIRANISSAKVAEVMNVSYGVIVNRTVLRSLPCKDMLSDDSTDPDWDNIALSPAFINDPVICYFATGDGKYTYIKSELVTGWIPTEDVAICSSKEEWMTATNPYAFLVVTGDEITTEDSAYNPAHSAVKLTMGTKLEICDTPGIVDNRLTFYNYVVVLPGRDANGKYVRSLATIPANRDVHIGYLPMTWKGVLDQSFKCLGNRYGWGGSMNSNDCSSYALEVYRCFGLMLPRNTTWQANMNCKKIDISGMSNAEKQAVLHEVPAGAIIQMPGHEMIYLGEKDGENYVINSVSSFCLTGQDGSNVLCRSRTVVVNGLMDVKRKNGSSWLDNINRIIIPWEK